MKFKINKEEFNKSKGLWLIEYKSWHNWFHLVMCFIVSFMGHERIAFFTGLAWDIGDGLKPHYTKAPKEKGIKNWFKRNLLFSNYFSFQDVLVWNLLGCVIGTFLRSLICG